MKNISAMQYKLISIDYRAADDAVESQVLEVKINDSYKITKITPDQFELSVIRAIMFEPVNLYSLRVELGIRYSLVDDINGIEFSEKYIIENHVNLVNSSDAFSWVSFLVSQISSNIGLTPIITPIGFVLAE